MQRVDARYGCRRWMQGVDAGGGCRGVDAGGVQVDPPRLVASLGDRRRENRPRGAPRRPRGDLGDPPGNLGEPPKIVRIRTLRLPSLCGRNVRPIVTSLLQRPEERSSDGTGTPLEGSQFRRVAAATRRKVYFPTYTFRQKSVSSFFGACGGLCFFIFVRRLRRALVSLSLVYLI